MFASLKWLVPAFAVFLPLTASAQSSDAEYCKALVAKYETYVVRINGRSPSPGTVDGSVAAEQCKAGNPAGIPVLERKLKDARVDLPART
jgi:hypothetical protein